MRSQYRVTVFGAPRGDWRNSFDEAKQDAIDADLATWDQSRREWYLAVPVDVEMQFVPDLPVKQDKRRRIIRR